MYPSTITIASAFLAATLAIGNAKSICDFLKVPCSY